MAIDAKGFPPNSEGLQRNPRASLGSSCADVKPIADHASMNPHKNERKAQLGPKKLSCCNGVVKRGPGIRFRFDPRLANQDPKPVSKTLKKKLKTRKRLPLLGTQKKTPRFQKRVNLSPLCVAGMPERVASTDSETHETNN